MMLATFLCCIALGSAMSISNNSNDRIVSELSELKDTVKELSGKLQALNESCNEGKNVLFYAIMTNKDQTHNKHSILQFETIIINEGNHYDPYDGVFVAPVSGVYLFSWTVSGYSSEWIATELVVGEKVIATAGEYNGGGGHSSGSMTSMCKLEKGDHAWIRTTEITTSHHIYSQKDYPQSSFLGLFINK